MKYHRCDPEYVWMGLASEETATPLDLLITLSIRIYRI